jgi:hypothetical protein
MDTTSTTFEIPDENLPRFSAKMAALAKRARRIGCAAPAYVIGEPRDVRRTEQDLDGTIFTMVVTVYAVTVSGESPRINGWTFAAVLDHEGELPIIRTIGVPVPERFRTARSVCEHCNTFRRRRETFVLSHEDGRYIQVGRSCLKDFLGHPSPEQLAGAAEILSEAMGSGGEFGESTGRGMPSAEVYLATVACVIRHFGWVPKSKASDDEWAGMGQTATASVALGWLEDRFEAIKKGTPCKSPMPSDEDKARAKAATAWAVALGDDGRALSDYEANVKAAAKREAISRKTTGIIASIIPTWDRENAQRASIVTSVHVGKVGERLRGLRVTVERVVPIESELYGTSYLNIMRDESGNAITWKASGKALETGAAYTLTGTVKRHSEFRGRAQTDLTRCKAERVLFDVEAAA